jgi:MoxR-like ATPase
MLRTREVSSPLDAVLPVVTAAQLLEMIESVRNVYVSTAVEQYAVSITHATRNDPELRLGASPRATLQLMRAAKAKAAIDGRDFVLPDDINAMSVPVLAHRLIPVGRVRDSMAGTTGDVSDVIRRIVDETPVPLGPTGAH